MVIRVFLQEQVVRNSQQTNRLEIILRIQEEVVILDESSVQNRLAVHSITALLQCLVMLIGNTTDHRLTEGD